MHGMTRIMLLMLGLLHLPMAFAGDAPDADALASASALDNRLLASRNVHRAALSEQDTLVAVVPAAESDLQLEFQDSSTLGRLRNLRSLSLLTLAETKRSKLFLGMNRRGLFGLHFGYTPGSGNERSLELARMPYLKRETPAQPLRD